MVWESQAAADEFALLFGRTERPPESMMDLIEMHGGEIVGPASMRVEISDDGVKRVEVAMLPGPVKVSQAAKALGVSETTVRRMIKGNLLETITFAGITRIRWDSLMKLLKGR